MQIKLTEEELEIIVEALRCERELTGYDEDVCKVYKKMKKKWKKVNANTRPDT